MKALIVDDLEQNRYLLRSLLQAHGFQVVEARQGAEALAMARSQAPDLVVSDLQMPVMDGFTLLRQWKADETLRHIPFVVYTATYTDPKDERLVIGLGADAFILKPAEPDELMARLLAVLTPLTTGVQPARGPERNSETLRREYSDALIRKLEKRNLELEEANRRLGEEEERLRLAVRAGRVGLWDWDLLTNEVYYSPEWKDQLGYSDHEMTNSFAEWQDRIHPEDIEGALRLVNAFREEPRPDFRQEFRMRHKDGSYRWILAQASLLRDAGGAAVRMMGSHIDITERRQAEEALREFGRRWQLFVEQAPVAIAMFDREMRYLAMSRRWSSDYGLGDQALAGRSHYDVFPEISDAWRTGHARGMAGEVLGCEEDRFERADGSVQWLRWALRPWYERDGSIGGIVIFTEDISARVQAQREVRDSESRYRRLFRAIPQPMWVYDAQTLRFLAVNDAALDHYGWSEDEFLAMNVMDIRPPEEIPRMIEALQSSGSETMGRYGLWHHRRKDASIISVEVYAHRIEFEGHPAVIVLASDVTEQHLLERERDIANEKFRALVEQSMVGVFMFGPGDTRYANPRAWEIFGYQASESDLPLAEQVLAERDQAELRHQIERLLAGTAEVASLEARARREDGSEVIVGGQGRLARIEGQPVVIGVVQDITAKVHAEESLQARLLDLERAMLGSVDAISRMMDLRDPYTAGHERRVGEIAAAIAAEMGLDANTQRGLHIAGSVHDIGKITVPVEILTKPGRISPIEYEIIKSHAEQGYEVLKGIDFPWPVAEVARQHHERLDGSGYPRGLRGTGILLEARIMAIADVVESMASHRPYRPTLGVDSALAEIEQHAGTRYDPEAVSACLRLFRDKGFRIPD